MDQQVQQASAPETTTTTAPSAPPTTAPTTPEVAASTPAATPGQSAPELEKPAFTPDFKFKVMDKEYEIDELYRGLIKDEESYKKIKEMHEKAYGLDSVKKQRDEFRDKYRTHEEKFSEVVSTLREVGTFAEKGDFDSFFEALGVEPQKVYQWVLNKVQYEQLPPEQKAIHDRATEAEKRAMMLERQYQQTQHMALEQATQARAAELRQVLDRPDVSKVMETFDSKRGKAGAFIDTVIFVGQQAAANGRDISAEEAVKEVMAMFGTFESPTTAPVVQAQAPTPPAAKPPVIPAVQGKSATPVKRAPKNLDDLRKLRAEMGE